MRCNPYGPKKAKGGIFAPKMGCLSPNLAFFDARFSVIQGACVGLTSSPFLRRKQLEYEELKAQLEELEKEAAELQEAGSKG